MKIKPVWGRAVILPDDITETDEALKRAKTFNFEIVSQEKKREQFSQVEGTLVSVGGNCFEDWKGEIPQEGQRVIYDKYAGFTKEINGSEYRIVSDTDIIAIIEE